jgi:hypothetical protein
MTNVTNTTDMEGADGDRAQGWRDYVDALYEAAFLRGEEP